MTILKEFVLNNFITLLLLIGFEFILFMNRKLPSINSRILHLMSAVTLLMSFCSTFESKQQLSNVTFYLLSLLSENLCWLGGMFYYLMCIVIIPVKKKYRLFIPEMLSILLCFVFMLMSAQTGSLREIPEFFSRIVILFYLMFLTVYAARGINRRSYADIFILLFIVGSTILALIFSQINYVRGCIDEVAAINMFLYLSYYSAVEQSAMQARLFENKLELAQSKMTVLMAQIQPHFIFNSLMAIQAQCIDYPEVYESLDSFAHYLRSNFDSLGDTKPVSFARELENIEAYLALEKMNFGDRLNVEKKIETTDFTLPALSVEPLVENAVRHGVATFEEGGTVRIYVKKTKNLIVVEIKDQGVGKRTLTEKQRKRRGIGVDNVRSRLASSSTGRLEITTEENGTCARLILNKKSAESGADKEE